MKAPSIVPIIGARMYIIILSKLLASIAGPIDLAGFIEAPVKGPPINEQTVIIPPIESPAINFETLLSVATLIIVSIRNILIKTSSMNPLEMASLLIVIPKLCSAPKKNL